MKSTCHGVPMRWEQLFADLDARFGELEDAGTAAELADRQRVEAGAVQATARLAGAIGATIRIRTAAGSMVTGLLRTVGPDWVLIAERAGRDVLVPSAVVTLVEGLTSATGRPMAGLALRLDLRRALRGLARDRSPVSITLPGGPGGGPGSYEITGTIDRVGADFVEVAIHAPWEPRRASVVRQVVLIPLSGLETVRPMPLG